MIMYPECLLRSVKKRTLRLALLTGLLCLPAGAFAFDWQSLWQRDDQQQWEAAEAYHGGDLDGAMAGFSKDPSAIGAYNRGNVLVQQGKLEEALKQYDQALTQKKDFADARYNRDLVAQALAKQRSEQNRESSQQKKPQEGDNDQSTQGGQEGQHDDTQEQPGNDGQNGPRSDQNDTAGKTGMNQQEGDQQSPPQRQQEQAPGNASDPSRDNPSSPQKGNDGDSPPPAGNKDQAQEQTTNSQQQDQGEQSQDTPDNSEHHPVVADQQAGPMDEEAQALELMLRQVPDDPGALLRRKFKYQYQNRQP